MIYLSTIMSSDIWDLKALYEGLMYSAWLLL